MWICLAVSVLVASAGAGETTGKLPPGSIVVPRRHWTKRAAVPAFPMESPLPASGYGTAGPTLVCEWPLGRIATNITCRSDTNLAYHLYLPRGLQQGRKYPVLFIVGAVTGDPSTLGRHLDGAERNGFILAAPSLAARENFDRATTTLRTMIPDVLARTPADTRRLYAGGYSDGSRIAVLAATDRFGHPAAGVLFCAMGGGSNEMARLPRTVAVAAIAHSGSIQRWDVACTVYKYSRARNSRVFFVPGTTEWGPTERIVDAMSWLNGCFLRDEKGGRIEALRERDAFAQMLLDRLEPVLETRPEWAADWIDYLEHFPVSGPLQGRIRAAALKLSRNVKAVLYRKALPDVEDFAREHFATTPGAYRRNNGTREAKRDADALLAKYGGLELSTVIAEFGARAATGTAR